MPSLRSGTGATSPNAQDQDAEKQLLEPARIDARTPAGRPDPPAGV